MEPESAGKAQIGVLLGAAAVQILLLNPGMVRCGGNITAATAPVSGIAGGYLKNGINYDALTAKARNVDIKTDLSALTTEQRDVLSTLMAIKPHADLIYLRQRSGSLGETIISTLRKSADPRAAAALKLLEINGSPYDPDDNSSAFNIPPFPKNGFAYPPDLTKEEFERYILAHPEQKGLLYSPYTVISRKPDGALDARYYHGVHQDEVKAISSILLEAAGIARNQELKKFLEAKSKDLLRDNYEGSYGDWISMKDSPVELVVGPTESYGDPLANTKESFDFALYTRDEKGADIINKFVALSPEIGRNLPLDPKYNPYLKDAGFQPGRNMVPVNLIACGGESQAYASAGWTLPNEPELTAKYGSKMLLISNVITTRGFEAMNFLERKLFGEKYDPETFYWLVAGHELSHGMLPKTKEFTPNGEPLGPILGDLDAALEETKADLMGLAALEEFAQKGELKWESYRAITRMYISDLVFGLYAYPDDAHAVYSLTVYNLLKDKAGVSFDKNTGFVRIDPEFSKAVREITGMLLKIQAEGDRNAAQALLRGHNAPAPEITAAMEALKQAGLPVRTHYNSVIINPKIAF